MQAFSLFWHKSEKRHGLPCLQTRTKGFTPIATKTKAEPDRSAKIFIERNHPGPTRDGRALFLRRAVGVFDQARG